MKKKVISIVLVVLMMATNLVCYALAENSDAASLTSYEELFEKGCAARAFVLDSRNNVVQAAKILDMLKK